MITIPDPDHLLKALQLFLVFLTSKTLYDAYKSPYPGIPIVAYSRYLPNFINRLIYFIKGHSLIYQGYEKYKDRPFCLLKTDGDLIVLPRRYADEVRTLTAEKLSSLDALCENAMGEYTNVLIESRLPPMTVSRKLVPNIGNVVPKIINELNHAFDVEVPKCRDTWVPIPAYEMLLRLVTRATSSIIAGETISRDEEWLRIVTQYTVDVGMTIITLRPFPRFLRRILARFHPSVRNLREKMHHVKHRIFIPMILSRRAAQAANPDAKKPDDFLQWMLDLADNPRDEEPELLAQNMLIMMSLAVVHTSTMAMTHALYDLILRPGFLGPIREEIKETLSEGWENGTWKQFQKLKKLDSFLRESQRFNPPAEVSFHRIVKTPLTFSDGLTLAPGTHICFPSGPLSHDADLIPSPHPELFDGFRWCDDTSGTPKALISIGLDNMHFGYGRLACPGRAFAASTLKLVLSRLVCEYEVRFEEVKGGGRPANVTDGENIFPNLKARIFLREVES